MIEHCPICNNKFESVMVDGIRRHAVCRGNDHVLSQEWQLFRIAGANPIFLARQCIVSYQDQSCLVIFEKDIPKSILLLEGIKYNLTSDLDWKELPKIIKIMKENVAFV